jgi:hypothetical protein
MNRKKPLLKEAIPKKGVATGVKMLFEGTR